MFRGDPILASKPCLYSNKMQPARHPDSRFHYHISSPFRRDGPFIARLGCNTRSSRSPEQQAEKQTVAISPFSSSSSKPVSQATHFVMFTSTLLIHGAFPFLYTCPFSTPSPKPLHHDSQKQSAAFNW